MVLESLDGLPLDVTLHETTSGVAALLDRRQAGADDAAARRHGRAAAARGHRARLHARKHDDTMHACGHDTHTAMLVGAAKLLAGAPRRARRPRAVHVPTRRGGPPRRALHARRGAARRPAARRRLAVAGHRRVRPAHHVDAADRLAQRRAAVRAMASADTFFITVTARAATPASRTAHSTRSRSRARSCRRCRRWSPARIDVFDPAVVTVGQIRPGRRTTSSPRRRDHRHDPRGQRAHPRRCARQPAPRR